MANVENSERLKANNLSSKVLTSVEAEIQGKDEVLLRVMEYPDAIHPLLGYLVGEDGQRKPISRGAAYALARKLEKKEAGVFVERQSGGTSKDYENQVLGGGYQIYKFSKEDLNSEPAAVSDEDKAFEEEARRRGYVKSEQESDKSVQPDIDEDGISEVENRKPNSVLPEDHVPERVAPLADESKPETLPTGDAKKPDQESSSVTEGK